MNASIPSFALHRVLLAGLLTLLAPALVLAPGAAAAPKPKGPSVTGRWSGPYAWPDVAIHLHLLPDGRVFSFSDDDHEDYHTNGTRQEGSTRAFIVDVPTDGVPTTLAEIPNTRTNVFCSGHSFLPDGRLLVMGGHKGQDGYGDTETNILDYRNQYLWSPASDMSSGRWYPSAVTLETGEILVVSGSKELSGINNDLPEVWRTNAGGGWEPLSGAILALPLYPWMHVAPNGRVFFSGPQGTSRYLDTNGSGSWSTVASLIRGSRSYGTSVMYDPGKVLVMGGGDPPTNATETIDLNAATPSWSSARTMKHARRQLNATILPDGKVLATGGTSSGGFNSATGAVYAAEMWDPSTRAWTTMSSMTVPRLYHSTAILLPDGRVLSAGGGRPAGSGGDADHENAEIFSPPYLFKGARPSVTSAPAVVGYGETFFVGAPEASSIAQVTWVRLGSATHAFNMNQRFNRLAFTQVSGGVQATSPASSRVCPPGHYMMFLINGSGVPSVAKIVQILPGGAAASAPAQPWSAAAALPVAKRGLEISPNPIHLEATLKFHVSRPGPGRVLLYDVHGRLVRTLLDEPALRAGEHPVRIDARDASGQKLSAGIYFFRVETVDGVRSGRVAILR